MNLKAEIKSINSGSFSKKVSHDTLSKLTTNTGHSVLELSKDHFVLLSFIKFIGCPPCQNTIESLSNYLVSFLKLNTIPIVCHQESNRKFDKFIQKNKSKNIDKVWHAQVNSKQIKEFGISSASFGKHLKMMPEAFKLSVSKKTLLTSPSISELKHGFNPLINFGLFLVYKGLIVDEFVFKDLGQRPNYGSFIVKNLNNRVSTTKPSKHLSRLINEEQLSKYEKKIHLHSLSTNTNKITELFPWLKKKQFMRRSQKMSRNRKSDTFSENSYNLRTVMNQISMRMHFKAFLTNEHSVENILFIEDVLRYQILLECEQMVLDSKKSKQLLGKEETKEEQHTESEECKDFKESKAKFDLIVSTYLEVDSFLEINISNIMKLKVLEKYEQEGLKEDIFHEIVEDLLCGVLTDSFSRFTESDLFKQTRKESQRLTVEW